jgi:hypothetical protein
MQWGQTLDLILGTPEEQSAPHSSPIFPPKYLLSTHPTHTQVLEIKGGDFQLIQHDKVFKTYTETVYS